METHKRLARRVIWTVFGRTIHGTQAIPVLGGPLKGRLLPREAAENQLSMLFGRYEPAVVSEIIRLSATTRVAYDIGAHVGYIALALAHRAQNGHKVVAFEPLSSNAEMIKALTALNGLEERVDIVPRALGDTNGRQKFLMLGSSSMHLLETAISGQDTNLCGSILVDSATVDTFVFEGGNPPPDLMKIDVEGAEALVLKGALRTLEAFSPTILIELHGPINARGVWELLDGFEYHWRRVTKDGRPEMTTMENMLSGFSKERWTHHFLLTRTEHKPEGYGGRA